MAAGEVDIVSHQGTIQDHANLSESDWAQRLVDEAKDFICIIEGGVIVYVNRAGSKMLGYDTPESLIGLPFSHLLHSDYSDIVEALLEESDSSEDVHTIKFQRFDGTPIDTELLVVTSGDDGLTVLQARDITERLKASNSVLQSENRYRQLVDNALDLTCVVTDGVISFINRTGVQVLGAVEASDLVGREVRTLVHPDYQSVVAVGLENLIGETCAFPLKFIRSDGEAIDVEISVMPFGPDKGTYMMEVHDITEQLRSADEIRNRENKLRGILETVADAVITIDSKGRVQTFNPAAETIFGYTADEVIDQNVSILMGDQDRQNHDHHLGSYTSGQRPAGIIGVGGREEMGRRKDGTLFPIELAISQLTLGSTRLFTGIIRDITERKKGEEELRHARDDLEIRVEERTKELTQEIGERRRAENSLLLSAKVIENLNEGVVITDADFKVTSVNRAFTRITGYTSDEIVGQNPHFYDTISDQPGLHADVWNEIEADGRWQGEIWNTRKDGTRVAERLSVVALTNEKGVVEEYAIVVRDITKRKEDEERIRYQANYDALTDLPNRALFMDRLTQALPTMKRSGRKLALMFLDLDGFKLVNDTLGHDIGDLLLQEASRRLLTCVRDGDTVARLGGDEFTIIMPNLEDPRNAPIVGRRVLDVLNEPFHLNGHETFISGSIGITIFPDDAEDATELIKNADSSMYRAKEQGKDNFQFYTADLNEEVKQRLEMKNGLLKALERNEFELYYQPKMTLDNGRIDSVEALLRWMSPELGMISPAVFVPILEETGMVVEVGEWALRTACFQHKAWQESGMPDIRVAVNLSARQLRENNFVGIVEKALVDSAIGPDGLEIEITESMLMSDAAKSVIALESLHDMGIHIAMDDFGTGYSSLSYLKRFPIDTIKIDRSFVNDIATSIDDTEIIRAILNMGQTLKRKVVAEGVETEEQLQILRDLGCDVIQGYLISPPLPSAKITDLMQAHRPEDNT